MDNQTRLELVRLMMQAAGGQVNVQFVEGNGYQQCNYGVQPHPFPSDEEPHEAAQPAAEPAQAEEVPDEQESLELRRSLARKIKECLESLPVTVRPKDSMPQTVPVSALNRMFRKMLNADQDLHRQFHQSSADFVRLLTVPYASTPAHRLLPLAVMKVLGYLSLHGQVPAVPKTYATMFDPADSVSNRTAFTKGSDDAFATRFGDLISFAFEG